MIHISIQLYLSHIFVTRWKLDKGFLLEGTKNLPRDVVTIFPYDSSPTYCIVVYFLRYSFFLTVYKNEQ